MYRVHTLPTKSTKVEATEESVREVGRSALRSVEDSLVLLQALRQSRQTWLTSGFVKFSTKSRSGKGSEIWQPPHTIRFRGKCDLEIGPHVFYATSIYEVTYQPYQAPVQTPSPYYSPSGQRAPGWTAAYQPAPQAPSTPRSGTGASVYAPSTTALVSSLKGAVPITNELIAQVNTAAVSNPTLANLLGLAASGTATPEQLQTLGVTIQSLADAAAKSAKTPVTPKAGSSAPTLPSKPAQSPIPPPTFTPPQSTSLPASTSSAVPAPVLSLRPSQGPSTPGQPSFQTSTQQSSAQPPQTQTINKDPDVVIEFYENSYDRWTLPKDLVLYERVKRWDGNNTLADIIFSTVFPFEGSNPTPPLPIPATPVSGAATDAPPPNKDSIHPITLRFFNVPPAIWNLFSKPAGDEERTKRVRAAIDAQLDKAAPRTYLQHRIPEGALLTQLQASASDRYPTKLIRPAAPAASTTQAKRRAPATPKDSKEGSAPPPKRKRMAQAKKPEPKMGKCEVCLRAPVALAPDTPYCPTCDKAKKASGSGAQAKPTTPTASASAQATPAGKPRPPAVPSPYAYAAAGRPSIPNYYAWQNQAPYAYQAYQPHPQTQPQPGQPQSQPVQPQPQSQPQPVANQPAASVAPPSHPQPKPQPATQAAQNQTGSVPPAKKKSQLAAMD